MLAASRCYRSGVAVAEIARQAGVSKGTIYRWIKTVER